VARITCKRGSFSVVRIDNIFGQALARPMATRVSADCSRRRRTPGSASPGSGQRVETSGSPIFRRERAARARARPKANALSISSASEERAQSPGLAAPASRYHIACPAAFRPSTPADVDTFLAEAAHRLGIAPAHHRETRRRRDGLQPLVCECAARSAFRHGRVAGRCSSVLDRGEPSCRNLPAEDAPSAIGLSDKLGACPWSYAAV